VLTAIALSDIRRTCNAIRKSCQRALAAVDRSERMIARSNEMLTTSDVRVLAWAMRLPLDPDSRRKHRGAFL
jgi:hypothetical protein